MKMIKAIVRPEKAALVLDQLGNAGFRASTKFSILGRGKQRGLKVEDIYYDEIPNEMLMLVVEDADADKVVNIISDTARTKDEGYFGDGKIFVQDVERAITISAGKEEL